MHARNGSGELWTDFAAKAEEVPRLIPLWRRSLVRWLVGGIAGAAILIAGVALALGYRWQQSQLADLAAQRRCLRAFLASGEFGQFIRTADAELIALNNFIAAQPVAAREVLREVQSLEASRHQLPWVFEVMPLPISFAAQPDRVLAAHKAIDALLARHGFRFDTANDRSAEQLFLRLLAPHVRAFLTRAPENSFSALALDRTMQAEAMAAFAARHGPGSSALDGTRMFLLYSRIGPAMWRAIERDREEQTTVAFVSVAR